MSLHEHLEVMFAGTDSADEVDRLAARLARLVDDRHDSARLTAARSADSGLWSRDDVWIIAYPDQFQEPGRRPLDVLPEALNALAPNANGVHVLPCYPWSSDDGYAVVDPFSIEPDYGTWDDIRSLAATHRVMLDAVLNHVSAESEWFQRFLEGDPDFIDGFVTADPADDLSDVVRPRDKPLLTPFETTRGTQWVWTTFSEDQVDLDVSDPKMLVRVIDVVLTYVHAGAAALRLDAIGFWWKQPGTSSIHLPQTHAAVQLVRELLDRHHEDVVLVTETNVPHEENVSYFGRADERESQAVYQFSLPPLVLHTMHTGDATALADWVASIHWPSTGDRTFLNFLASHDGIGLRPAEGLLDDQAVAALARRVKELGGVVNERSTPEGPRPYELSTTWFDAVALGDESRGVAHHLASHAILFLLPGIALVYAHSLVGSSNDHDAYRATGQGRSLNRRRFRDPDEYRSLEPGSRAALVNAGLRELIELRRSRPAFDPDARIEVAEARDGLFRFYRGAGRDRVLVEVNVSLAAVDGIPVGRWRVSEL